MTYPLIRTMTIDAHDPNIPVISFRFIEMNATNYFLARDVAGYLDQAADEDGDYRSALEAASVSYTEAIVSDRETVIGPVAVVTEAAYRELVAFVKGRP
ncbi:hypothetical protein [Rhizobium sp. BE258]|uniref:hypothetical protein n=1 Tax=Rhizobium sp. BE258 TaxID=2817722 RepID=UPI00286420EC|nr:hypothetical protein [Rhizobium sp. BE258]MDR7145556.1 hypothetical protein [Rhizobium sp. BE258]